MDRLAANRWPSLREIRTRQCIQSMVKRMQLFRPHSSSGNLTPEDYVERGSAREQERVYLSTVDSGFSKN
jgi:hypothetical protein